MLSTFSSKLQLNSLTKASEEMLKYLLFILIIYYYYFFKNKIHQPF